MIEKVGVLGITIIIGKRIVNKLSSIRKYGFFILTTIILNSCRSQYSKEYTDIKKRQIGKWSPLLNNEVTLIGEAKNSKLGALLAIRKDSIVIWIDGIRSWPIDYAMDENNFETLEVTGTLIEKYDLPIFRKKELSSGEIQRSGIPVRYGINLKLASHRFLLKDATWIIIDE